MIHNRSSAAFTMVEMLLVIGLIGFLAAAVMPRVIRYMSKSDSEKIKFKMSGLKNSLQEYRMEFGSYPTEREGLRALVENPRPNDDTYRRVFARQQFATAEEIVADKSGNEFVYHCPPQRFKNKFKQFEILYFGPSGQEDDPAALEDGI